MKIKILEYKVFRGNKVRVQSHNKHKGKWKPNKNWRLHQMVLRGDAPLVYKKEYEKEV